jgi:hypothetical protein
MNRAQRRAKGVASEDAFRTAFVQAEMVMRQALSKKIDLAIDEEEDEAVKSGLRKAQKIVMGELDN